MDCGYKIMGSVMERIFWVYLAVVNVVAFVVFGVDKVKAQRDL